MVITEKMAKIHNIVLADRRVKIKEIVDSVQTSTEQIQNIIHKKFRHEKVIGKMGAAFAHNGSKTELFDNFKALFEHVQINLKIIFATFCDYKTKINHNS